MHDEGTQRTTSTLEERSVNRYQHVDQEIGASNEKDLEIAKLKLEAFELR